MKPKMIENRRLKTHKKVCTFKEKPIYGVLNDDASAGRELIETKTGRKHERMKKKSCHVFNKIKMEHFKKRIHVDLG